MTSFLSWYNFSVTAIKSLHLRAEYNQEIISVLLKFCFLLGNFRLLIRFS